MIGYYVHHQGHGHRVRAEAIAAALSMPVTVLSSLSISPGTPFADSVRLPRDDLAAQPVDVTAHGSLHWAPRRDPGYTDRMAEVVRWIAAARPAAIVVDVSVEIAFLARLLGVPVVVIAMPGMRNDDPHQRAYRMADAIVAPWPRDWYAPEWLAPHMARTVFTGGISRFGNRPPTAPAPSYRRRVLVLAGAGGTLTTTAAVRSCAAATPQFGWHAVGVGEDSFVADPWPMLCSADVVVGNAGQNTVADIAAAARPAVLVADSRPYGEQHVTADMLDRAELAVTLDAWPAAPEWPRLLERALATDGERWRTWQTAGAADRAAAAIEAVAA